MRKLCPDCGKWDTPAGHVCGSSPEDRELAALFVAGATMTEIAAEIGVSRERVRQRLERAGVSARGSLLHGKHIKRVASERLGEMSVLRGSLYRDARASKRRATFARLAITLYQLAAERHHVPTLGELQERLGITNVAVFAMACQRGTNEGRGAGTYKRAVRILYAAAGGMTPRPLGSPGHLP